MKGILQIKFINYQAPGGIASSSSSLLGSEGEKREDKGRSAVSSRQRRKLLDGSGSRGFLLRLLSN